MSNMPKLFAIMVDIPDYLFFRLERFFLQRGDRIASSQSSQMVALLEVITLVNLFSFFRILLRFETPQDFKLYGILTMLVIFFLNNIRYGSIVRINEIRTRWKGEDHEIKRKRGVWIVIYIVLCICGPFVMINF